MTKQTINVGSGPNAGDGESLRSAMQKANGNFDELYTGVTGTETSAGTVTLPYTLPVPALGNGLVDLTMSAAGTLTMPASTAGVRQHLTVIVRGGFTPTWGGTIYWPAGTVPTANTNAAKFDVWRFTPVIGGTAWIGRLDLSAAS